jgi:hypothetical protein
LINENGPILAFTSSFFKLNEKNFKLFCNFINEKINNNTEIEMGIAIDPYLFLNDVEYIKEIKNNIKYLNKINNDVTYTFLLNIDDYKIEYIDIFEKSYSEFDTTIDFIPSVARSGNKEKILQSITKLNQFFDNLKSGSRVINNIMIDHSHGGANYQVINWRKEDPYNKGKWYISPFIYENMVIYDDFWEIKEFNDIHENMKTQLDMNTDCKNCEFFFSCYNRKIQLVQQYLGVSTCIVSKSNLENNRDISLGCANSMYDWVDYSNEKDRNGYRDKFIVTDDNIDNIDKIKEIYNANK